MVMSTWVGMGMFTKEKTKDRGLKIRMANGSRLIQANLRILQGSILIRHPNNRQKTSLDSSIIISNPEAGEIPVPGIFNNPEPDNLSAGRRPGKH